jgi:type III restriction enzyme
MDGQTHDYMPDFLVRLQKNRKELGTLILETKGFDPKEENKKGAAERWVKAVNYDDQYGHWVYRILHDPASVPFFLEDAAKELESATL